MFTVSVNYQSSSTCRPKWIELDDKDKTTSSGQEPSTQYFKSTDAAENNVTKVMTAKTTVPETTIAKTTTAKATAVETVVAEATAAEITTGKSFLLELLLLI